MGRTRAEQVVPVAGCGDLGGAHCAAGLLVRLEDQHGPARVGQHVRGNKPVGTGADDNRVRHASRS